MEDFNATRENAIHQATHNFKNEVLNNEQASTQDTRAIFPTAFAVHCYDFSDCIKSCLFSTYIGRENTR